MSPSRITIEQALEETHGEHCPKNTELPCVSMGSHTEWPTLSGKVYAKCRKCLRAFILKESRVEVAFESAKLNANDKWWEAALGRVRQLCEQTSGFTTDDVWSHLATLDVSTKEPRALGAVMIEAASRGWCRKTDRVKESVRPECHKRPVAVWNSLLRA